MSTGQHVTTGDETAAQMEMRMRWLAWLRSTQVARFRLHFWCDGRGEWLAWGEARDARGARSVDEHAPDPHTLAAQLRHLSGYPQATSTLTQRRTV